MARGRSEDWCILRTSGRQTLAVADSLTRAGFECWTPRETIRRELPRKKVKREIVVPIMPTFVFASAAHLSDLVGISLDPRSSHPDFSVQQYHHRFPLIADRELNPLRIAERKGTPLERINPLKPGDRVKFTEGGFEGMSGVVETSDGKWTLICFPNLSIPIKIATLHLLPEAAMEQNDIAAKAA